MAISRLESTDIDPESSARSRVGWKLPLIS
jgi:hypothetical protein